jgi:hypothetical protein
MSADPLPYWVLLSVLFSTFPLEQELALALHQVALDLHQREDTTGLVDQPLAHGRVTNLHREAVVGSIAGPVFEAELETERGKAQVRFILTRQGLELLAQRRPRPAQMN